MSEKPSYWKYFKATRHSKTSDDIFYIYNKKKGIRTAYKMPEKKKRWQLVAVHLTVVFIPFIVEFILFNSAFDNTTVWRFLQPDLLLASSLALILLSFAVLRKVFSKWELEKVSEFEWDKYKEKEYRKTQRRSRVFWILYYIFIFAILLLPNLFCLSYLRSIADGGEGKAGSAEISIDIYNDMINLDEKTIPGEVFTIGKTSDSRYIRINIDTARIPNEIRLFINGEEIDIMKQKDISVYAWSRIWDSDYFETHIHFEIKHGVLNESNSIEIKAGSFDKVWTFTINQR